jgi:carbon monoxide dehydrogenase subunit G
MKVQLEQSFDLPGPAEAAWAVLRDIERVAACMPGARITERIDDAHYKGTVAVKFGPANMSFRGEVEVMSLDAAAQRLRLVGKGTDSTGSSGASMDLTARIEAVDGASSKLTGTSEVSMSGKAAAFGGRMMQSVADQVLQQFADNFAAQVRAAAPGAPGGGGISPGSGALGQAAAVMSTQPAAPLPAQTAAAPLNGLALAWAIFRDWLRSLFAPRKA